MSERCPDCKFFGSTTADYADSDFRCLHPTVLKRVPKGGVLMASAVRPSFPFKSLPECSTPERPLFEKREISEAVQHLVDGMGNTHRQGAEAMQHIVNALNDVAMAGPPGWTKKTCRDCKLWIDRATAEAEPFLSMVPCTRSVDGKHDLEYELTPAAVVDRYLKAEAELEGFFYDVSTVYDDLSDVDKERWNNRYTAANQKPRPRVVCLCGSTRFTKEFEKTFKQANYSETLAGHIVLAVSTYVRMQLDSEDVHGFTIEVKAMLDELHKRRIDLADEILVLNVGGHIDDSMRSEIEYAKTQGKPIRWLEPKGDLP